MVCCDFTAVSIVGLIFSDIDYYCNCRCCATLEHFLLNQSLQILFHKRCSLWIQWDRAITQTANESILMLILYSVSILCISSPTQENKYSLGTLHITWSPDLTGTDYFHWSYMKVKDFEQSSTETEDLTDCIVKEAVNNIIRS